MDNRKEWIRARDDLIAALGYLGFPKEQELGTTFARQLGSPKAIRRMTSYLYQAKPRTVEEAVDEMLGICSEIETWRQKKASEEANAQYNEIRYHGFGDDDSK